MQIKICIIISVCAFLLGAVICGFSVYFYTKVGLDQLKRLNQQSAIDLNNAKKSIADLENANKQLRQSYNDITGSNQQLVDGYNKIQELIRKIDDQ